MSGSKMIPPDFDGWQWPHSIHARHTDIQTPSGLGTLQAFGVQPERLAGLSSLEFLDVALKYLTEQHERSRCHERNSAHATKARANRKDFFKQYEQCEASDPQNIHQATDEQ